MKENFGHCGSEGRMARSALRGVNTGWTGHNPITCPCCQDKVKHSLERNVGTTYSRGLLSEMEYRSQDVGRVPENSSPHTTAWEENAPYYERFTWDELREKRVGIRELINSMKDDGVDPRQIKGKLLGIGMLEEYGQIVDGFNH